MLAEQLARADRKPEALEQLQLLYDTLEAEGRTAEAAAAVERMKTIDPSFTPLKSVTPRQQKKEGLVFLDLSYDDGTPPHGVADTRKGTPHEGVSAKPSFASPAPLDGLELTSLADTGQSPTLVGAAPVSPAEFDLIVDKAEASGAVQAHDKKTPASSSQRYTPPVGLPPLDLAPLVLEPLPEPGRETAAGIEADASQSEPVGYASTEAPAAADVPAHDAPAEKVADDAPGDFTVPLYDMSTSDPLAGLDVISTPGDDEAEGDERSEPEYVDLALWLEQTRTPQSTRMVAHDDEPEDNQQKDFEEMLEKFKLGVSRSVDDTDFDSHYDLGIAFGEMGLIDEAISAFQKATRGSSHKVRASEALGECFIEKGQPAIAVTVLEKLIGQPELGEDSLIGVFYLLGRAAEELDKPVDASAYYHRVIAVDMGFRDASQRLASLAGVSR